MAGMVTLYLKFKSCVPVSALNMKLFNMVCKIKVRYAFRKVILRSIASSIYCVTETARPRTATYYVNRYL